jgi:site-specific recombinase XerD
LATNSVVHYDSDFKHLPTVLTAAEQSAILAVPNKKKPTGFRNYVMLLYFLYLGLRVSEAINLKTDHIDWGSGKLTILASKNDRDRVLWLQDNILELSERWLELRPSASDYLFCNLKGGQLMDRYIREFVSRYAKKGGIKKRVHPHSLRHTFATDLLREAKDIRLVQKALGHASIATTMIYTHIVDDRLENALKHFRKVED